MADQYSLRFEKGATIQSGFVGGRGEHHATVALLFSDGERDAEVALLDEYDRRPFYDAWEYSTVHEAKLFAIAATETLCIQVGWHDDAEWNTGGPVTRHRYFISDDGGTTWSKGQRTVPYILDDHTLLAHVLRDAA